jgi:hypothetical protein
LIAASGVAFAAVFPLSRDRESVALAGAPDMLALVYLELALGRAPENAELRLQVVERMRDAGELERARRTLQPLLGDGAGGSASDDAALLALEIDYRAWAALDGSDPAARARALERLTGSIGSAHAERLPLEAAEHVAWVSAQAGLAQTRAEILARVARADLTDDTRLCAADSAFLETGDPLAAAELRAERALSYPERGGAANAALALRRALAAGAPGPALVLFRKLRARFGHDPQVLELGLSALAGVDDVEALSVATELLAQRPEDEALRERVAQLHTWTRPAPAPSAPRAPAPSAPPPLRWDGSDAALGAPSATDGARAIELAALLESLGAPEKALRVLEYALSDGRVDERAVWDLKAGVLLRLGKKREALETLTAMDDRFGPSAESIQRRADLLLSLGELGQALDLLATAPGPREVEDVRRITAIGWELGDVRRVRAAYRVIVRSPEATPDDVRRLWLLEREGGDLSASARVALDGFRRFEQAELGKLALHTAIESGDEALVGDVLAATEKNGGLGDADALRLQVATRQARAHRALASSDTARAEAELRQSERLLALADAASLTPSSVNAELWEVQDRQKLNLALAEKDRPELARVYPEQAEKLTARERVFVLHQLGRDEDAVNEAVASLSRGDLPEQDTSALEQDAASLGADMPRQLGVLADVQAMEGLTLSRVGANARLSWSGGRRLGVRAELTRLGVGGSGDLLFAGQDELAAELSGGIGQTSLAVGIVAIDGADPRPSLRFEQGLLDGGGVHLDFTARVNERSLDTPVLRVMGVEDELAARASLEFAGSYVASLRGSAKLFSDRDRDYLGAGASLDAAVGRYFALPGELGVGGLRVAGYVAPRFEADPAGPIPEGASWLGVGASLTRGQLSVAPIAGRRLSVLADVTAGWLMPLAELGWSTKLGVGISVLGADQLSIVASASNVVSTLPGFAVYTLGADYAVSRW